MLKKSFFFIVLFFTLTQSAFSQYEQFGKLSPKLTKPDYTFIDSTVAAVVLFDVTNVSINKQFEIEMKTHKRVLIKNEKGFDQGTLVLNYFPKNSYENIVGLEAINWIPLNNGKYKKVKVSKKSIYKEILANGSTQLKFTFPELMAGCIVEYQYVFKRNNLQKIPIWTFQSTIPVVYSEIQTEFPSFFKFEFDLKGRFGLTDKLLETYEANFYYKNQQSNYNTSKQRVNTESIRATYVRNKFVMKDIPAYESEPFSGSSSNYLASLEISLRVILWPNTDPTQYFTTWQNTGNNLLKDDDISDYLKQTKAIEKEYSSLGIDSLQATEKIEKIYEYVTKTYSFNKELGLFPDKSVSELQKGFNGNASSINLLFIEFCKMANLEVYPVAIATTGKGFINRKIETSSQFNSLIAEVVVKRKSLFIDATDSLRLYSQLPLYSFNGDGLRLKEDSKSEWVPIKNKMETTEVIGTEFTIDEKGSISGLIKLKLTGYKALNFRQNYVGFNDTTKIEEFLKEQYFSSKNDIRLDSIVVVNMKDIKKPIEVNLKFNVQNYASLDKDRIRINPLYFSLFKENPFVKDKRRYPIDYGYSFTNNITVVLNLPKAYEVEEEISPIQFSSPDNELQFKKLTQFNTEKFVYSSDLKVLNNIFPTNKYEIVKEFYQNIAEQQTKSLVLKKIGS